MRFQKYSLENLKEAIKNSISYRQVLSKLKIIEAGGNYSTLKRAIKEYQLDTSHFLGMAAKKGKTFGPKFPLSEYLNNNKRMISHKLKKRLIKEKVFEYKCYSCNLEKWLDKPIPLELDHIDGNHDNNNLNNLRILCPNCHAFTPTYRGRKNKLKKVKNKIEIKPQLTSKTKLPPKIFLCSVCSMKKDRKSAYCKKCSPKYFPQKTKIEWPSLEVLNKLLEKHSMVQVGKNLGVSDNAIRKHIKNKLVFSNHFNNYPEIPDNSNI